MFPFKKVMPISENASFDDLIQIIVDAVSECQAADDTIKEYKWFTHHKVSFGLENHLCLSFHLKDF